MFWHVSSPPLSINLNHIRKVLFRNNTVRNIARKKTHLKILSLSILLLDKLKIYAEMILRLK